MDIKRFIRKWFVRTKFKISQITIKNEKDYIKIAGRIKESLRSNKKFFKTSLCKTK